MKSLTITLAAYTFATATFLAAVLPTAPKAVETNDIPAATGIMLDEVVISSLPTCTLPEVTVSTKDQTECTLPEVVILYEKPKA